MKMRLYWKCEDFTTWNGTVGGLTLGGVATEAAIFVRKYRVAKPYVRDILTSTSLSAFTTLRAPATGASRPCSRRQVCSADSSRSRLVPGSSHTGTSSLECWSNFPMYTSRFPPSSRTSATVTLTARSNSCLLFRVTAHLCSRTSCFSFSNPEKPIRFFCFASCRMNVPTMVCTAVSIIRATSPNSVNGTVTSSGSAVLKAVETSWALNFWLYSWTRLAIRSFLRSPSRSFATLTTRTSQASTATIVPAWSHFVQSAISQSQVPASTLWTCALLTTYLRRPPTTWYISLAGAPREKSLSPGARNVTSTASPQRPWMVPSSMREHT
mmetsp:Transcript_2886/g.8110  ORF Transcript_2886/g.8110 Transcript_2886/m.8110 type:complete len:325 (-) Transcript_2886:611-1585(-)